MALLSNKRRRQYDITTTRNKMEMKEVYKHKDGMKYSNLLEGQLSEVSSCAAGIINTNTFGAIPIGQGKLHPLPIHATLLQHGCRDCSGYNISPLAHRRAHVRFDRVTSDLRVLILESSQRIFRIIKASPPRTTHAVLVKVSAVWTSANEGIGGVREPPMRKLSLAFDRSVYEEDKNHDRNGAQRTDNPYDRILPRFAVVI